MTKDREGIAIPLKIANIAIPLPDIHITANKKWILPWKAYGTKLIPICHLIIEHDATLILQRATYVKHLKIGKNIIVEPINYLHVLIDTTEISVTGENSIMEDSN
ncbi:hypothetical protein [Candidatus Trichorickettsia mobilis]|uniref:hypothetical protein n=1 Tax=Candidatus Trichorickettsia mobilis TaxID=1346319 RepID=UPI00292CF74A|nr:hypothetical protein [Candidatus Trichorickettsia mobilis]